MRELSGVMELSKPLVLGKTTGKRDSGLARKSRSRKAILRLNALLTGLRFTSEREKCFMLKFLRYHNARVLRETRPCTGIGGLSVAASHPLLIL